MKILALDASAAAASAALIEDGTLVAETFLNVGLTHSQTLLPLCEQLLSFSKTTPDQIDTVAVTAGPGSFTGVRIAVSTVKGLAFGRKIGCAAISTLEALAYPLSNADGVVCAAMDARCGQVYNALFLPENGKLRRLTEDRAIPVAELEKEIKNLEKKCIFVGDGADLCYNSFKPSDGLFLAPPSLRYAHASSAAFLAIGAKTVEPEQLDVFYLRLPQAERERMARLKNGE